MKSFFFGGGMIAGLSLAALSATAGPGDTTQPRILDSVLVQGYFRHAATALPNIEGVHIFAGKKTQSVELDPASANLAQNITRMAFARIPGLTMWDMDGAGTQVNIGSRGTDSHRSIEMNMRQNGYVTNSDIFGYPEDHYTVPLQGVQRVELVRGSAALQFGSQFGGMMNYVMKEGDSTRPFGFEGEVTRGSFNFLNAFVSAGGRQGKWSYYAYYDDRSGDGWRPNAAFRYHAYYANVKYSFSGNTSLAFQFSRMDYRQQIAGGLTDAQFAQNNRQSFRARNYFNPFINIPALLFKSQLSASTRLEVTAHGLTGQRNSVQFINTPNIYDTINTSLNAYNPRQVDRDYYDAFTTEARVLHRYRLGAGTSTLTAGVRFSTELTKRRQKGVGTDGSDFDLGLVKPYGIDLRFHTQNFAVHAENIFHLTPRLDVVPGFRYEVIDSKLTGVIANASFPVSYTGHRTFPLFGTGLQYRAGRTTELYGNISQAYRPFLYANVTPADQLGVINPDLKDSKGYDADLGWRGTVAEVLRFDVNVFYTFYGDRIGQLTLTHPDNSTYLYTTNIGNSGDVGAEAYAELQIARLVAGRPTDFRFSVFNSLAYNHARYLSGSLNTNGKNLPLKGNHVENVPDWMERTGVKFGFGTLDLSVQYSYTSKQFSDANNTAFNATGVSGPIPAYQLVDLVLSWRLANGYSLSGGVNNLADTKYFSRRINMYPGPGILPADGRSFYVSLGVKL